MTAGLDILATASLSASLDGLAAEMRDRRQLARELAAAVAYIPEITAAVTSLPAMLPADSFAPRTGYAWAVQAIRVTNLAAATDYVQLFRGKSVHAAQVAKPAVNTFLPGTAAPFSCPPFGPGRTGLVLKDGNGLAVGGVVTGIGQAAPLIIEMDVIQVEVGKLAYFLL